MIVGAEEARPGFGSWFLEAGKAYFDYDVRKAQAEAGVILQEQGLTREAAAIRAPGVPGLLQNPLVMGGLAMLAGIAIYKLVLKK